MYGAKRRAVQKNYESVWEHGGYLTVKSKKTSRISCKKGAGIFVINEVCKVGGSFPNFFPLISLP